MNTPLPHHWTVDTPDDDIKNKLYVDWRILSQQVHLLVVKTGQGVEAGQRFQPESTDSVHSVRNILFHLNASQSQPLNRFPPLLYENIC